MRHSPGREEVALESLAGFPLSQASLHICQETGEVDGERPVFPPPHFPSLPPLCTQLEAWQLGFQERSLGGT